MIPSATFCVYDEPPETQNVRAGIANPGPLRVGRGKVISNNESTKSIVHEKHERHEQDMLLFVFFVPFVESFFPADQIFDGMFS